MFSRRIGRDDCFASALGQPVPKFSGVIGAICDQALRRGYPSEQGRHASQIMDLPWGQGEGQGPAKGIGYGVNLGRPSAARPADRLLEVPPFAPAAERCALT